jgi:hypothetical protein
MNHKILAVNSDMDSVAWNKHLPVPLRAKEKVIVDSDQSGVQEGYVRVKHGPADNKVKSVFSVHNFTDVSGSPIGVIEV